MSESEDEREPAWELLPHQPRRFFELEPDFDKRELKRRYTRLIKRFKPERSPEEFQRIRAAYEELLDELRSGSRARPRFDLRSVGPRASGAPGPGRGDGAGSAS